jgi:hypothetical protein
MANLTEIDITSFYNKAKRNLEFLYNFSDSEARSGNPNVGKLTWENAKKQTKFIFVTAENAELFRDFFLEFGAWEREELEDINELNALFTQNLSADIKERLDYKTWKSYEKDGEEGRVSSNLFIGTDKKVYYNISN